MGGRLRKGRGLEQEGEGERKKEVYIWSVNGKDELREISDEGVEG